MHTNYFFLKKLTASLSHRLKGLTLAECFSQEKDELILSFYSSEKEYYIRAYLSSWFTGLSFPETFHRSRKNSVNIFNEISGKSILDVIQHPFDRSFHLEIEGNFQLMFKLFGTRSNLILFREHEAIEVFNHQFPRDLEIDIKEQKQKPDLSLEKWLQNPRPKKFFPQLGKEAISKLKTEGFEKLSPKEQHQRILQLVEEIEDDNIYLIEKKHPVLVLFSDPDTYFHTSDPVEAANKLTSDFLRTYYLQSEKNKLLSDLQKRKKKTIAYLEKAEEKEEELRKKNYRSLGDLLMASLHNIPDKAKKVTLKDFYTEQPVEIRLNPDLSPQKNAENYYRKAKNQFKEEEKIKESILSKYELLEKIEDDIERISKEDSVKQLKQEAKKQKPAGKGPQQPVFKEYFFMGFKVMVGRNSRNNDELLQVSSKNDIWLHAKDSAGSHVIIRQKPGTNIPTPVLEKAAATAAYFSKLKNETVCPVIYTERKYVRKRKGFAPGQVSVEKEKVILVKPEQPY